MTIFGFTIGEVALVVGGVFGVVGGYVRLQMSSKQNAQTAKDALRVAREAREQMNGLKLDIAEKYASVEHLKEVEARLAVSIDRLTDRIDKLLSSLGK